jgi:hypothetical protein
MIVIIVQNMREKRISIAQLRRSEGKTGIAGRSEKKAGIMRSKNGKERHKT